MREAQLMQVLPEPGVKRRMRRRSTAARGMRVPTKTLVKCAVPRRAENVCEEMAALTTPAFSCAPKEIAANRSPVPMTSIVR
jgi:hypothetical protein